MQNNQIRILIIEDSLEDQEAYQRLIQKDSENQYVFLIAATGEKGLDRLFAEKLTICIGEEDYLDVFSKQFKLGGTPVYLLLLNGKEVNRFLGMADENDLVAFISNNLS